LAARLCGARAPYPPRGGAGRRERKRLSLCRTRIGAGSVVRRGTPAPDWTAAGSIVRHRQSAAGPVRRGEGGVRHRQGGRHAGARSRALRRGVTCAPICPRTGGYPTP